MFKSATVKLTAWYLLIACCITLIFSFIIYQMSVQQLQSSLQQQAFVIQEKTGISIFNPQLVTVYRDSLARGQHNLQLQLLYVNIGVLAFSGAVSYLLARRTLRPIEEAHTMQSRFSSDVSHELKTPLASIQTEIEVLLLDSHASKEDYKQQLSSTLEEVEKLNSLSNALLRLSRLDTDQLPFEPLIISEIIDSAIIRLKPISEKRNVRINPMYKNVSIQGNQTTILELFTILLENATKYSDRGGEVNLHMTCRSQQVHVSIHNHGQYISRADMPHIFERFYRGDSSRSRATGGYGLGLSLAQKIAQLHGGEIHARSTAKSGTTFTVILPKDS